MKIENWGLVFYFEVWKWQMELFNVVVEVK